VVIRGVVQGVGFRPFIFRLARELDLSGWVRNGAHGVSIEVEGSRHRLDSFLFRIEADKPVHSFIHSLEHVILDPAGYKGFEIGESETGGEPSAPLLPDIATCPACLDEILDPRNRRYRYPFTNCTHCGPRFTIIEGLPYDRATTSMKSFGMCARCRQEYADPLDRRFHAQPNACPECGPHLELRDRDGMVIAHRDTALQEIARAIHQGATVAVKGLGGFHLMVDAGDAVAVKRLRERKHRDEKPFALMVPSVEVARTHCEVSRLEERLLRSPESPIVLLRKKASDISITPWVAPGNPSLGVMLPYTPLHHLLMGTLKSPVVATSGNLSEEPICIAEDEALDRLGSIADLFLVHNRPIVRHVDDSVVRVVADRVLVLRRARGYAPLPVTLGTAHAPPAIVAVGAQLKNTVAISVGRQVLLSQHIGDMSTLPTFAAFERSVSDLKTMYNHRPRVIVCDAHPDYVGTRYAERSGLPVIKLQHHVAHVLACMAENEITGTVLGVSWDGTGFGTDGTLWGGEFLRIMDGSYERLGHLRTFRLPGGEQAIREPRRAALGLLYEVLGGAALEALRLAPVRSFERRELLVLRTMIRRGINAPATSSAGRLFDAVAAITGLRQRVSFEGQAAMDLEFLTDGAGTDDCYPFEITGRTNRWIIDWAPMVRGLMDDVENESPRGTIAVKFHNTLAEMIAGMAQKVADERVVLTGGCFQNRYLTERVVRRLDESGFRPYWHQRIPPNDGGIALGQIVAASLEKNGGK
jgi:hydrogenase maturation protein HypF